MKPRLSCPQANMNTCIRLCEGGEQHGHTVQPLIEHQWLWNLVALLCTPALSLEAIHLILRHAQGGEVSGNTLTLSRQRDQNCVRGHGAKCGVENR